MPWLNADIIIFSCFLAANLVLGLQAGRRVKSLHTYAIGDKDFSTSTLTSTIVATWLGGGFMFYGLDSIYKTGLQFSIATIGASLGLLITGQFLIVRMGEFLNNLSVAEAMGDLYGKTVRVVTAISGIAKSVGSVAIQFKVIGQMLALVFGFQGPGAIVAAAVIVIAYSAFGGIRSVAITDIFQFITFVVFIPMLSLIVWNNIQDPDRVAQILTSNPIFYFRSVIDWSPEFLFNLSILLYLAIPGMNPAGFQRIAIARDLGQAQQSFTYAAGWNFLIKIAAIWVVILVLAENSNLESGVFNYLIDRYTYAGFKGLVAIGIMAMAMSTADSYLNASAVMGVHDIITPLQPSAKTSLSTVRLFSLVIGLLSLLLALRFQGILNLMLFSGSLYMPVVTVPILLAILGFRSSTRAILIGMAAGISTVLCWRPFMAHTGVDPNIPGMGSNLVFLMGSHYLLREAGGWVGIKVPGPLIAARQKQRAAWQNFFQTIRSPRLYIYLRKNLPTKEGLYSLFGIYVIGATYASFSTVPETMVAHYQAIYNFIAQSVLIAAACFITYPAWPPTFRSKRFIAFAWPLGIGYILFLAGGVLVLMSGFHQVQVMIFMLNLVMAALLLDWTLMLFLAVSGIVFALGIFQSYAGAVPWAGVGDMRFRVIYGLPLFISLLVALIRFRQVQSKLTLQNTYLIATREEARRQLAASIGYGHQLAKELEQDELQFDSVTTAHVKQAVYRMVDYMHLEISQFRLARLLDEVKDELKFQDFTTSPQLIVQQKISHEIIQADMDKIRQLLVEAIVYIHKHNTTNQPITIALEEATLGHTLDHMEDYLKKLAAIRFTLTTDPTTPPTQEVYMISPIQPKSQSTKQEAALALLENLRIIDAHYGYVAIEKPTTHIYVIPANVREIRAKVMERLRTPAAAVPEELTHPLAIQLEKELFDKLQGTAVDLQVIKKALDTIKKYHRGTRRKSGEPFFTHPLNVAIILLEHSKDQDAVVSALLHDTVEDTQLSLTNIRAMFGNTVAFLIEKATNLQDNIERRVSLAEHETLSRLIYYEDPRAALIKLSDRLHNMRTLEGHSSLAKRKKIAYETWIFFVPLALHLQLHPMARELKELSLKVLEK